MKYLLPLLLLTTQAYAQLTITITSIPSNTPPGDSVWVAGTFNNWSPKAPGYHLTVAGTERRITLPSSVRGAVEFKFTRGSWAREEVTASGGQRANRTNNIPASGTSAYSGNVAAWKDLLGPPPSTATASVSILSDTFYMPQLGRRRRIWLYLPPDYATSTKTYPVLYMHDGQNLFDATTSFSGEWGVDEALDQLQRQGDYGCIVVGIDNGGAARLDEYSPYRNSRYGGGQGDAYVDFIALTLKPYIDARFRTQAGRLGTGIMGSSMGGLISLYAGLKYPQVFGRVGVFSPSLWFSSLIYSYARRAIPVRPNGRMYLMSGGRESLTQAAEQRRMADTLAVAGFAFPVEADTVLKADGQHAEWFWRREFADGYRYLFVNGPTNIYPITKAKEGLRVYPNPGPDSGGQITVESPTEMRGQAQVIDAAGKTVRTGSVKHGKAHLYLESLPLGCYRIQVGKLSAVWVR